MVKSEVIIAKIKLIETLQPPCYLWNNETHNIGSSLIYLLPVFPPELSLVYLAETYGFGALPTSKNVGTQLVCQTL